MKRITCSALIAVGLLSSARADLTIVQKIEGAGSLAEMTMKIRGDKARIEATPEVTSIFDGKTGEMLNIINSQKLVMRMSADQAKAAAAVAGNQLGTQGTKPGEKVKVTPTGNKEKINGYDAEEYVAETPSYKASYWVAKDYPQADSIMKQLQATSTEVWNSTSMGMPDFRDFPGLPIRTNVSMAGQNYVTTITAVKMDALPDTEFNAPQGYKEMKMPDMGGLHGGKPPRAATAPPSKK
ncbi:MAG TPA: DUF4412 domain-containing protein, partial [Chthoniobacterales bacterium]|nr:DUF4412 domain-containing protein [Chthoniobacterales bacterium]